jgi:hypothetical protein
MRAMLSALKYIGAYLAGVNGAEAIVFGGGIGEDLRSYANASVKGSRGAVYAWMPNETGIPLIRRFASLRQVLPNRCG